MDTTQSVTGATQVATMHDVQRAIEHHRDALLEHPFLRRLEGEGRPEQAREMLKTLGFFPFGFQDMLRLARERCSEPVLERLVRTMEVDDRGHDRWFLQDLRRVGVELDVATLFSGSCQVSRDVSYSLLSQVLGASDDRCRLALLLSLEAAGRAFFERVPGYAERCGVGEELAYFSRSHLEAEEAHEVFEHHAQAELGKIEVTNERIEAVLMTVERAFGSMAHLADAIEAAMRACH